MKSEYTISELGPHVTQISVRNKANQDIEVYSVTNSDGFKKSTEQFSKEVYSKDLSNYKVVRHNEFAYNPSRINVGSIDYLKISKSALISPLYIVFKTSDLLVPNYLLRYLKSNWGEMQIRSNTEGAVRDSLKYKGLEKIKLPLPALDDQIRITYLLEKIENLITQRKQQLQQLDDLLKSVFLEMFGDPIRNEKSWKISTIENLCQSIIDCPHSTPEYSDHNTGLFCVRSSDLVNGYLNLNSTLQVEQSVYNNRIQRYKPVTKDIIYTREGGRLGNAARIMSEKNVCLGQRIMLFKVNDKNNCDFLWALLESSSFKFKIQTIVGGGAAPRVNIKDLKKIIVIAPPLNSQKKFSSIVQRIDNTKLHYEETISDLETLYNALSQKAFKGELDLSRIPLPDIESETQSDFQTSLINDPTLSQEELELAFPSFTHLDESIARNPKMRVNLLKQWLHQELLNADPGINHARLEHFWSLVEMRAGDYLGEMDFEGDTLFSYTFKVEDYDALKQWVFDQIRSGEIQQHHLEDTVESPSSVTDITLSKIRQVV